MINNETLSIIKNRASCRNFSNKEIPEDVLSTVLEAACQSPSGGGFQMYSIIKTTDIKKKQQLARISKDQRYVAKAPVNLLFCIDMRRIHRINEVQPCPFVMNNKFMNLFNGIADTIISAQTLCIAAESVGLKSLYIGNIIDCMKETSEIFNLPKYVLPVILVCLGYPKSKIKVSNKYHKSILVHDEVYKDIPIDELIMAYEEKNKNWKIKAKDELVNTIYRTAKKYHGEEYAEKCKEDVLEKGYLDSYQYWFGCFYLDNDEYMKNNEYIKYMKKQGFNWLE